MKPSLILPGVAALVGALALLPACDRNDRNEGSVMNQRTTTDDGTTSDTSASGTGAASGSSSTTTTDTTGTTGAAGTAGSTAGTGTSGSAAGMGSSSAGKSGASATKSTTKKNKKSGTAGKQEGDLNGTGGGTGDKHMSRNEETIGAGEDEITVVQTEERMPSGSGAMNGSTSGSTTGAADIDMNMHNPARGLDPLMALEPYSRMPVHIGSVQVTGKDKSVAVLEDTNRFIDPNALARNESGMIATIPIANLDLDKFGPRDRHAFQAAMMTRLGNLDHRLDHIRATTMSSISAPRVEIRDRLAMLEGRHSALEEQVDYADTVGQDRWESFKTGFRDQLATFERDLANLSVSAR